MTPRRAVRAASLSLLFLLGAATAFAGSTYTVDRTIDGGTVVGTIETDGTIGSLVNGNILDWNLTVDDGVGVFTLLGPLSGDNSEVGIGLGAGFTATATDLRFDFSSTAFDFLFFQSPFLGAGAATTGFWCTSGTLIPCFEGNPPSLEAAKTALGSAVFAERAGVVSIASIATPVPALGAWALVALAGCLLGPGTFRLSIGSSSWLPSMLKRASV